ncbi:hypothetical protein, partial [Bradyrhizobium japonicum]|uniref:hypothetical protein n=1 Tax=Bradyrhizobium japonicum TaxID=375 RepID=UPI001AEBFD59
LKSLIMYKGRNEASRFFLDQHEEILHALVNANSRVLDGRTYYAGPFHDFGRIRDGGYKLPDCHEA